jgi:hypothetical protein
MNGAIIAIWPVALLIAAAVVGVPLWMTIRHRHARAAEPVAAVDGLTIVHKTGAADDDVVVPVQRHW